MPENTASSPTPRICLYTRAWRSSGVGLFAQELAHGFARTGTPITLIAPHNQDTRFEAPTPNITRWRPPHEIPGRNKASNTLRSIARIITGLVLLLAARLRHRLFIITIADPLLFSVPVIALLRLTGAHIIWIAHDPLPHAWRMPRRLRWLERATHAACYHIASHVVVLSAPTRQTMEQEFPSLAHKVSIIEHGVFPMEGITSLPGSGTLLIFGSLRRNKGITEAMSGIIAAREAGIAVKAVVAGAPTRDEVDYAKEIEAIATTAPGAIDLRSGYVDDNSLRDLINQCDALMLAYTDFQSQSGVALLAASNARPVIAAAAGGIGALIAEGMPCATIASPVTTATVAEAVRQFMQTPAEQWRKSAHAYRDRVMQIRSWESIANNYASLARNLDRSP